VRIGVIADPHVSVDRVEPARWHNDYRLADSAARLERALSHELIATADVVAILGDLSHFGDRTSIDCVAALADTTGKPHVLISGNHDVLEPDVRVITTYEAAAAVFRRERLALHVHNVSRLTDRATQPFDVEVVDVSSTGADVADVVLTHFPVLSLERRARHSRMLYAGHLEQLAPVPPDEARVRPTVILSGHLHLRGVASKGDTLQYVAAALVEAPYEVSAVDIDTTAGGAVRVRYRVASVRTPEAVRLPVLDPPRGAWTSSHAGVPEPAGTAL